MNHESLFAEDASFDDAGYDDVLDDKYADDITDLREAQCVITELRRTLRDIHALYTPLPNEVTRLFDDDVRACSRTLYHQHRLFTQHELGEDATFEEALAYLLSSATSIWWDMTQEDACLTVRLA